MVAMSALGELPMIDLAIHADTTHERKATYEFAERWTPWLRDRGVKVVTVQDKCPRVNTDRVGGEIFIPAYTGGFFQREIIEYFYLPDGSEYQVESGRYEAIESHGVLRRQCTDRWKIKPIRRYLQSVRNGKPVELWLGISTDEALRIKPSDRNYIINRWPLIESNMSRNDCIAWLKLHNLEVPVKSSCVFCPYHDSKSWREIWKENGEDWHKAVEVDELIRKARPPYDLFVHPARRPLKEIDLRNEEDRGQLRLWDEECSGFCGT